MRKKGGDFHIYIKDPALAEIFEAINEERGELSAVITDLAWNGMEKIVEKHLKKRTAAVKRLRNADKTLKNVKRLRKTQKDVIYREFCHRMKTAVVELDHKANLAWIEKRAGDIGMRPETLLIEIEKRYKKEK